LVHKIDVIRRRSASEKKIKGEMKLAEVREDDVALAAQGSREGRSDITYG
jgi:hypothetical protein